MGHPQSGGGGVGRETPSEGSTLHIRLLGRFAVHSADRVVLDSGWNRRKALELLKLVALQPEGSFPRERAMDIVWPDLDGPAAGANLRKNLHYLRTALRAAGLPEVIVLRGDSLALPPHVFTDVTGFRAQAKEALANRTDPAAYEAALELYGGELLPEDLYQEWTEAPREQLGRLRVTLLDQLARLYALRGDHARAVARLEKLLDADVTNEGAHRFLIQLHGLNGEPERALRQYELCTRALQRELGIEPSREDEGPAPGSDRGHPPSAVQRVCSPRATVCRPGR